MCQEWDKKKEPEKKYPEFYRAVHAVAFSTGTKLKTRVQVLNKVFISLNFNVVAYIMTLDLMQQQNLLAIVLKFESELPTLQ